MKNGVLLVPVLLLAVGATALMLRGGGERERTGPVGPDGPGVERPSKGLGEARAADVAAAPGAQPVRPPLESTRTAAPADPTAERAPVDTGADFTMHLTGGVVGEFGVLADARVEFLEPGRDPIETRTGKDGNFALFVEGPTERGHLRVECADHAPVELAVGRPGRRRHLGQLTLVPGVPLRGRVVDERGSPVADAVVRCTPSIPRNLYVHETRSRADGRFDFATVPRSRVRLLANAPGHGAATLDLLEVGSREVELVLGEALELRLRVVLPDGRPVEGVLVRASPTTGGIDPRHGRSAADGKLTFQALEATLWDITVNEAEYRPYLRSAVPASKQEVELTLAPWPCLTGRLLTPGGTPAPRGSTVQVLPSGLRGDLGRLGGGTPYPVGEDGSFRVCGIRPGTYIVRAEAPGFAPTSSRSVQVSHLGDLDSGVLVLDAGGVLELVVQGPDGKPTSASAELYLTPPPPSLWWSERTGQPTGSLGQGPTGAGGAVVFRDLAAGRLWVLVRSDRSPPHLSGPYVIVPGERVRPDPIRLEAAGFIEGRVTSEGRPLSGALVVLLGSGGRGAAVQLRTGGDGRFRSPPLTAGSWTVRARYVDEGFRAEPSVAHEVVVRAGATEALDVGL